MNKLDCTFARTEMASALARLSGLIPSRTSIPVALCTRISATGDGGALRLEATDFDRHGETLVSLSEPVDGFDSFCVPLSAISDFAKAYPGVSARLRRDSKDSVVFSSGGSKATLLTIPGSEFPEQPADENYTEGGKGSAGALKAALHAVSYAIGTEITKPAMLGVNFGRNGTGCVAVASNGQILAKETVTGWESDFDPATLPTAAVNALLRFLPDSGEVSVRVSDTRFRFITESGALTSGTLESPYPTYAQLLESPSSVSIRLERAAFLSAVQRVRLVLRSEQLHPVALRITETGIALSAQGEMGSAEEFVSAEVEGDGFRIGLSAAYMADTLSSLTDATVVVKMHSPLHPTLWSNANGDGVRLIAPLHLRD